MQAEKNFLFRQALNDELLKRIKKNPHYSIRSFAKFLQIEPSSLAQIISHKRTLSDKMCSRLGDKLGFSPLKMRALTNAYSKKESNFQKFGKLEEDAFTAITDWYHYAILELTYCDEFRGEFRWIAKVLKLSIVQVTDAVARLQRLKYLEITKQGQWIDKLGDVNNLGNEVAAKAFAEHQKQILAKALDALENVPYERRVQSSMTVAVSKERVIEAKKLIHNFIEELNDFLRSGSTKDEVYNISVSLYPTSNIGGRSL